jgi:hypothetical protein
MHTGAALAAALMLPYQERQLQVQVLCFKHMATGTPLPQELLLCLATPPEVNWAVDGANTKPKLQHSIPPSSPIGVAVSIASGSKSSSSHARSHGLLEARLGTKQEHSHTTGCSSAEILAEDTSSTRCRRTDGNHVASALLAIMM